MSIDRRKGKEDVVHIYIGTVLSFETKMPLAATWRHLEVIILSEGSQAEKNDYHMISLICGI